MGNYRYSIYGLSVQSAIELASSVSTGDELASVSIELREQELYPSVDEAICYRDGNRLYFQFEDDIGFSVDSADDRTVLTVAPVTDEDGWKRVRMYLLGPMLAYVLELRGIVTLHASCVDIGGNAVGFLSTSGGGKSNLAATAACNHSLIIADDITAVDVENNLHVQLGPARMKLWPDDIPSSWGPAESFDCVHPAYDKRLVPLHRGQSYAEGGAQLRCLYVPTRSSAVRECRFENIGGADALVELVRQSFSPQLPDIIGVQGERLKRLAEIVERVPLRRMIYPDGKEHLASAWKAVTHDFTELIR